jgi:transposase
MEGSANREVCAAYVGKILCPELHEGDVVILDNLCIHKTPTVARLIEAKGAAVRYLPAYSPDLNPIEMAFAKLKSHLRQAGPSLRQGWTTSVNRININSSRPNLRVARKDGSGHHLYKAYAKNLLFI